MTEAEIKLWSYIRNKQINGLQFYRQKPLGKYIVDFYCPSAGVVIEVDGGQHYSSPGMEKDAERDNYLKAQGLTTLRYSDIDVLTNIEGTIENLIEYLSSQASKSPFNPPFLKGEAETKEDGVYEGRKNQA
jgi:very-short-patch-repair endonuclease